MNTALLHSEVQQFIRNYTGDTASLALKGSPFESVTTRELIQQIEGFRKTKKKLPTWHGTEGILYPPKLSVEQASSEITAHYKASLFSGKKLADCTGGLGVDSYYFAKRFELVTYFEQNEKLAEIASHNFKTFGRTTIRCEVADALTALEGEHYDVIYVDPARRHATKGKVFFLKDCEPNLVAYADQILAHCDTLLVKTSPMLDIEMGLSELKQVRQIHVVAVDNEVKELLWVMQENASGPVSIQTVHFGKNKTEWFQFVLGEESWPEYALPQKYLYEPNAAIMKSGAFNKLTEAFGVAKLHINSHLYTSESIVDFPGRVFKIDDVVPYRKSEIRNRLWKTKANITTRNFPETVAELRKKWKIRDGGEIYLFFTTIPEDRKVVLICSKLNS